MLVCMLKKLHFDYKVALIYSTTISKYANIYYLKKSNASLYAFSS